MVGPTRCPVADLACRLQEARIEYESALGETSLAEALGLPIKTWRNYESGVTIPGVQLLQFIERTGFHPVWLLTGRGDRYLAAPSPPPTSSG